MAIQPEDKKIAVLFKSFSAGAASSFVSTTALQPLDVLKTRLQQSAMAKSHGNHRILSHVFCQVIGQYGIRGFWRGLSAVSFVIVIYTINFYGITVPLEINAWNCPLFRSIKHISFHLAAVESGQTSSVNSFLDSCGRIVEMLSSHSNVSIYTVEN